MDITAVITITHQLCRNTIWKLCTFRITGNGGLQIHLAVLFSTFFFIIISVLPFPSSFFSSLFLLLLQPHASTMLLTQGFCLVVSAATTSLVLPAETPTVSNIRNSESGLLLHCVFAATWVECKLFLDAGPTMHFKSIV